MAQRYTNQDSLAWMEQGLCPECGQPGDDHGGWGGSGCSLTDNGVHQRIDQYNQDKEQALGKSSRRKGVRVEITFLNAGDDETQKTMIRLTEREFRDFLVSPATLAIDDSPASWDLQQTTEGNARLNTIHSWVEGLYASVQTIIRRSTK